MDDLSLKIRVQLVDQASAMIKSLSNEIEGVGKTAQDKISSIKNFSAAVTGTALVVGGYAVTQFATYEKTMSKVQAVTESTAEEMDKLHKLAQTEGARTKFSTNEVAQSMYVLGQAGLDASKQMQVLPQVLDLATAGDMELARSADIMIGTLNGMNLKMTDSSRVIDVMAKTANISAIDLNDYGESMKYIAPTAAALGISIEEVSAYIAIMGNNGEKGSIATRAFGTSLANLAKEGSKNSEALAELGVSVFDTEGKFVGLAEMTSRLEGAMKGMTQQERLSYLTRIFGAESLQEVNILMAQGSDKLREYTKTLEDSDGAARQMADTMADNLAGSWEQFTGAIESVGIQLGAVMGSVIRPALDSMTEGIRNLGEWFNSLSPNMQAFLLSLGASIGIIVTFTAALGAILFVVTPILGGISAIASGVTLLAGGLTAIIPVIGSFLVAIGPIGWIIIGITAALAGLYAAWTNDWGGMRTTLTEWYASYSEVMGAVGVWLFDTKEKAVQFVSDVWTAWSTWWGAIGVLVYDSLDAIGQFLSSAWLGFTTIMSTAWTGIVSFFTTAWALYVGAWRTIWETVKLILSTAWTALKTIISTAWNGVVTIIDLGWTALKGLFSTGTTALSKAWSAFGDGLKSAMIGVWEGIKYTIASGINWVIEKINFVIEKINSAVAKVGGPQIPTIPKLAFADGGLVPGSLSAPTDSVVARVTPGELILNRAQQENIAGQLGNGGGGGTQIVLNISGNSFVGTDQNFVDSMSQKILETVQPHLNTPAY